MSKVILVRFGFAFLLCATVSQTRATFSASEMHNKAIIRLIIRIFPSYVAASISMPLQLVREVWFYTVLNFVCNKNVVMFIAKD